ncbi:agmatine deiminase family protein [Marinobacter sp. SS21]|uniref:agmatine deiminase family protein n=1 Tax=Marinobacter sp. SS21 TaxID=2979460 RepID=UPI003FA54F99
MLTWPHAGTDWCDILDEVEPVFFDIARSVLRYQNLIVSCEDADQLARVESTLQQAIQAEELSGRLTTISAPADDTWARDHGPIAVKGRHGLALLDFSFNAWGGKFPHAKDDQLNQRLANAGGFGALPLQAVNLVLEGGSIESNGEGTILTTSECLLTPTRNPSLDRADIESALGEHLGAKRVLWLNHGYLAGDDTDSHIDTLARFYAPDGICYVSCPDPGDEHYPALNAMKEELEQFQQANGRPFQLTPLPWPEAIYDDDGERLPATYANFLIINQAILLPIYDVPQDGEAIEILAGLFPEREIIPINCRALIKQHGSLHCVTMQIPSE